MCRVPGEATERRSRRSAQLPTADDQSATGISKSSGQVGEISNGERLVDAFHESCERDGHRRCIAVRHERIVPGRR